jgi:GDP-L-fucose synthase
MDRDDHIYVAGHTGLVGSAILRRLERDGFSNVVTKTHDELDLTDQAATDAFFGKRQLDVVFLAAAKVGGILANDTYPADFISENLAIQTNVLRAAHRYGVEELLFLGSSCVYPKHAPQPIPESALLTGPLEPTNRPYAVAKIAGIEMCRAFNEQHGTRYLPVMPSNVYGPRDNFDLETGHVLAALLRKFHTAKTNDDNDVTVWGTGTPRREFLYVDDLADACVWLMAETDRNALINIGLGKDVSILELAEMIAEVVGFDGEIVLDESKPDGTPRKLLDTNELDRLGWAPPTQLEKGLRQTYDWLLEHSDALLDDM